MIYLKNSRFAVVAGGATLALSGLFAGIAFAASTIVVTPTLTHGWSTADTRPGGAVNFISDATAPGGSGALQLTTNNTTAAKAQYMHAANVPLAEIASLSYYAKQSAALFPQGDPSYQLVMFLNGGTSGFSTLVFEPYQNLSEGAVVPHAWQQWNVKAGLFWSTRTVACSNGTIVGTHGGPANYTLAQIQAACPNAVVAGFGVNIGSNNPGYTVSTDLVDFNGTVYDFEVTNIPTEKHECKEGGYVNYTDASDQSFKNQGQCVAFVEHQSDKHEHTDDQGEGDNN